jgi:exonuclease SbcD
VGQIAVIGDIHEGITFGYRVNPETGISERALDLHRNFIRASEHAIEAGASLFILAGDLFDRPHVAPVFREMVRTDVVEPLLGAGIDVWILAGNHDQPRSFARSTSLDDYRGYRGVEVFRRPATQVREIDGERIGFILLPYLHPQQIAIEVREKLGEDFPREEAFDLGRKMWREWLQKAADSLDADYTILIGHYHFEGCKLSSHYAPEHLPGEFSLTRDMVPEAVDLAVFGHIHLHQVLGDKIVYTGAPERIDWGERGQEKGFVMVDTARRKWRFARLPSREMVHVEALVPPSSPDPTADVLKAIPEDVAGKLVRLIIRIHEGQRGLIDEERIARALKDAFHYDRAYQTRDKETVGVTEFTMDPFRLFDEFVGNNYGEHPLVEEIRRRGEEILKKVLA